MYHHTRNPGGCSNALPGGLHLRGVDLIGAGGDHFRDAGKGVIGIKCARNGEGIGGRCGTRGHTDAGVGAGTPIGGCIHELDGAAGAVGRDMEGRRVFQGHVTIAGHPGD